MNKISFLSLDSDELVSGLDRFSEALMGDLELAVRIESELPEKSTERQKVTAAAELLREAVKLTEDIRTSLLYAADRYEQAEESVKLMIRKKLFLTSGNVTVEKSLTPAQGGLLYGHTLCHDERLGGMVLKDMAGEKQ
ncbi:MAG: hypothetical protein E7505_06100 [Ruminococcus sp.]|nr:hypothetical protein [Ruminococcus sp.]